MKESKRNFISRGSIASIAERPAVRTTTTSMDHPQGARKGTVFLASENALSAIGFLDFLRAKKIHSRGKALLSPALRGSQEKMGGTTSKYAYFPDT